MIERVTQIDDELVAAFVRLMPQLSPTTPPPTREDLAALIASPGAVLLIARDPAIIGAATLTLYRIPTGMRARIDDVVVDTPVRGGGIGEALTRELIALARAAGARSVSLTSAPHREAANRLYRRLGFEPVTTNVYRLRLD